jgi:dolichyl-phosphooligosaccharide-protein glycotransferase
MRVTEETPIETKKQETTESDELNIDVAQITKNALQWIKKNYIIFLILIPILLTILIRLQPAYLPIMDASAENNVQSTIRASIEAAVNQQYPNLPGANKQALIQEQMDQIYAQGYVDSNGIQVQINDMVAENAASLKAQFQDVHGLTYLGEIDPWYFYRLTENYIDHGYEGDKEIDGYYHDTYQLGGTPRETLKGTKDTLPHFHVAVEVYLYKITSLFMPSLRLMTLVYFLPVLLAALSIIPTFFLVRKVAGDIGALVASIIVGVHPAFVGRTVAGFSDTDGYNILFPLFIMWAFIEAVEAKTKRAALVLAIIAGFLVGIFSKAWGGWWYIYDFLLGISFISLWYIYTKEWIKEKERKARIQHIGLAILFAPIVLIRGILQTVQKATKKEFRESAVEQWMTTLTITTFVTACAIFVSLFSGTKAFINAIKEPFSFTTIKDVAVAKIWPNVLTTVAEFSPASLHDILSTASFGMPIILLTALLGIGYILFERNEIAEQNILAVSISWVVGVVFVIAKIESTIFYLLLLLIPLAWCAYKKVSAQTAYFVMVSVWYAAIIRFTAWFSSHLYLFFALIMLPVAIGALFALVKKQKIDLKYAVLLSIWFVGTIYASTKGVRFIMILVPAFSVAVGLGIAFIIKLWTQTLSEFLKLKKIYLQVFAIVAVTILLIIPISIGYKTGYNQLPLINDQWYNALQKIDQHAAPDAIVSSWWDFGHWFKAIANRPVTFDGGSQDTPQAHWIGRALLTDDENEAIGIMRMLDCGGNAAYDTIFAETQHTYKSIQLTKLIIMQTAAEAKNTLREAGITEDKISTVLLYTHCDPPEGYFITSQDMVNKAAVWGHFGSWDFAKAHMVNIVNNYPEDEAITLIVEDIGVTKEEAQQLYTEARSNDPNNWIAPWPSYVSLPGSCMEQEDILYCDSGLFVDLNSGDAQIQTVSGANHPYSLIYLGDDGDYAREYFTDSGDVLINNGRAYGAALVPNGNSFSGFLMDESLVGSMFNKLFFFKGHGLECFDLFGYQRTVTQEDIYVWKIDWSCQDKNVVFEQNNN